MNLEKYLGSRKFIALLAATVLFAIGKIDQEFWSGIVMAYMAAQAVQDSVVSWNKTK